MIAFTTRNRPSVLEYSLRRTREIYDGLIIVIDDHSETKEENRAISNRYDAKWFFNNTRLGIPRSKARGFDLLQKLNKQYWFDDDCFPKKGFFERMDQATEYQPHILHLKDWTHIKPIQDLGHGLIEYAGATACFMSFTEKIYPEVDAMVKKFKHLYGHWHPWLSIRASKHGLGIYVAVEDSSKYIHSFDMDGVPRDYNYHFQSCMSLDERRKALTDYITKTGESHTQKIP